MERGEKPAIQEGTSATQEGPEHDYKCSQRRDMRGAAQDKKDHGRRR